MLRTNDGSVWMPVNLAIEIPDICAEGFGIVFAAGRFGSPNLVSGFDGLGFPFVHFHRVYPSPPGRRPEVVALDVFPLHYTDIRVRHGGKITEFLDAVFRGRISCHKITVTAFSCLKGLRPGTQNSGVCFPLGNNVKNLGHDPAPLRRGTAPAW
jgi:hypothetical protein